MQLHSRLGCKKYRRQLWREQNGQCKYCQKYITFSAPDRERQATVDHVVPLWRGGSNTIDNLVVCCLPCNSYRNSQDQATDEIRYNLWLEFRNFYNKVA